MDHTTALLISGLRDGDNSAYEKLYRDNYPPLERYVLKNSGTAEDAKDIFQDSLIVLLEKLKTDNFQLTASLKTYLAAIGKNLWLKKLRNISYRKEMEITDIHAAKFYTEISLSIDKEKTYMEKLKEYMSKITTHCNHLLHAMFFKNKTIDEIQASYGYSSRHNAQNQKHKCIEQVRKIKDEEDKSKK